MTQSHDDAMVVFAAGYGSVAAAVSDFDSVSSVYANSASAAGSCDAAVINPQDTDLSSRVIRETPPSQQRRTGVEGLAKRLAGYLAEGLALTGGAAGGGGEVIPAAASADDGADPLDSDDLKELGAVQENASAVLIGIFPAVISERIDAATEAADIHASKEIRASAEQLEAQIIKAERKSIADAQR